jgi:flagellar biosynthesis GTPase FlhF
MRIERFEALDASRGMREINARYGDDVLIIANSRTGGKNQFVIAIDNPEQRREPQLDQHRPVYTAEALVKEFSKTLAGGSVPAPSQAVALQTVPDMPGLSDLAALMSAGFDELKKQIEQVNRQQLPAAQVLPSLPASQGETSLLRLMRLLSGCAVPVDLLRMLADVTADCDDDMTCVSVLRSWLCARLPDTQPLTDVRGVHCLVGAPGVGKTAAGIRLAAKLGRDNAQPPALFVAYKLTHERDLGSLQAMAEKAGVQVLPADDFSALVTLINEHISSAGLVIELPGHLHASELLRLQQRLPSAQFHLVLAADSQANLAHYVTRDGALTFSDVLLTRLDSQQTYWPLIHALIHYDVPLTLGSYSGGIGQSLVLIDKFSILDEILRGMSDTMVEQDSRESMAFSSAGFRPANKIRADLM